MTTKIFIDIPSILDQYNKTEQDSLGERVKFCLNFRSMTQKELADAVNLTQQNIQAICSSKVKSSRHTNEIAHALGVSPVWLSSGKEHRDNRHATTLKETVQIPVWEITENQLSTETNKFIDIVTNTQEVDFALYMPDNALSPLITKGNLLLFVKTQDYQGHDVVLAKLEDFDDKYLCRIISHDKSGDLMLSTKDPCYGDVISDTCPFVVIGVLKEIRISR